jgi:hypothetical protein
MNNTPKYPMLTVELHKNEPAISITGKVRRVMLLAHIPMNDIIMFFIQVRDEKDAITIAKKYVTIKELL